VGKSGFNIVLLAIFLMENGKKLSGYYTPEAFSRRP
jgi:hypothetical protein